MILAAPCYSRGWGIYTEYTGVTMDRVFMKKKIDTALLFKRKQSVDMGQNLGTAPVVR